MKEHSEHCSQWLEGLKQSLQVWMKRYWISWCKRCCTWKRKCRVLMGKRLLGWKVMDYSSESWLSNQRWSARCFFGLKGLPVLTKMCWFGSFAREWSQETFKRPSRDCKWRLKKAEWAESCLDFGRCPTKLFEFLAGNCLRMSDCFHSSSRLSECWAGKYSQIQSWLRCLKVLWYWW